MKISLSSLVKLVVSAVVFNVTTTTFITWSFLKGVNSSWEIVFLCFAIIVTSAHSMYKNCIKLINQVRKVNQLMSGELLPYQTPLLPDIEADTNYIPRKSGLLVPLIEHFLREGSLDQCYSRDQIFNLRSDTKALLDVLTSK